MEVTGDDGIVAFLEALVGKGQQGLFRNAAALPAAALPGTQTAGAAGDGTAGAGSGTAATGTSG